MRSRWHKPLIWIIWTIPFFLVVRFLLGEDLGFSLFSFRDEIVAKKPKPTSRTYTFGRYMANRRRSNASYCSWKYNLPGDLLYSEGQILASPEMGWKGPYRVLPSVISNETFAKTLPKLTLCTHATSDQVYAIVELATSWEGAISLAIFVPGRDASLGVALLQRACSCEPAMSKVSVHFVFPLSSPPVLTPEFLAEGDCDARDLQYRESETMRKTEGMVYPINVARNVARTQARTLRVLVSDIELVPSAGLTRGFLKMVRRKTPQPGVVFVVPVFEVEANEKPPRTKRELLVAYESGLAVYFHRYLCVHCQRFPGLERWLIEPDKNRVTPLLVTKREAPNHRWEPVFIGTKKDPLYTEEMSWEGRQDKMAQMFEMCLLNYRLVVLDGAFLVHTPGIKRKVMNNASERSEQMQAHVRRNSRIYKSVIRRLLNSHPSNKKCRL